MGQATLFLGWERGVGMRPRWLTLERKVGQQVLEIDFLKGCLQRIEEQRMLQALMLQALSKAATYHTSAADPGRSRSVGAKDANGEGHRLGQPEPNKLTAPPPGGWLEILIELVPMGLVNPGPDAPFPVRADRIPIGSAGTPLVLLNRSSFIQPRKLDGRRRRVAL